MRASLRVMGFGGTGLGLAGRSRDELTTDVRFALITGWKADIPQGRVRAKT
jgi:hypothetical protein